MAKKIVAVMGSYRRGCAVDSLVLEVLRGASEAGAETVKVDLLDKRIEFCTNCRACTQEAGGEPGRCVIEDDFAGLLALCRSADGLVLGAPVNFYNVNALTRRWLERHVCTAYWPWRSRGAPKFRDKTLNKKAVLVTAAACPAFLVPLATGAVRALKAAAMCLGAKPSATVIAGLMGEEPTPKVPARAMRKAYLAGKNLAS